MSALKFQNNFKNEVKSLIFTTTAEAAEFTFLKKERNVLFFSV